MIWDELENNVQAAPELGDAVYRRIMEQSPEATLIVDRANRIVVANREAERVFGYRRGELVGEPLERLLPARYRHAHHQHHLRYYEAPERREMRVAGEIYAARKDGTEFPAEVGLCPINTTYGLMVTATVRDITARREAEESLRESEERFRRALEDAPIGMALVGQNGRFLEVNRALCELVGYPEEELVRLTFQEITHPDDLAQDLRFAQQLLAGEIATYQMEKRYLHKDGQVVWILLQGSLVRDSRGQPLYYIAQMQDITERKRAEEERTRLLESEQQKSRQLQLAIREAHHRIKNNLQSVTDLLSLQMSAGTDPESAAALRESMLRVQAIAAVHDLLSSEADVETVDIRSLAERLVPMLFRGGVLAQVSVKLDVTPALLPSADATALALILNELVSNAAKHAFDGRTDGRLEVSVQEVDEDLLLRVCDDGPGLPPGFDPDRLESVGLQVVRMLATGTLHGTFTLRNGEGVCAEVRFPRKREH